MAGAERRDDGRLPGRDRHRRRGREPRHRRPRRPAAAHRGQRRRPRRHRELGDRAGRGRAGHRGGGAADRGQRRRRGDHQGRRQPVRVAVVVHQRPDRGGDGHPPRRGGHRSGLRHGPGLRGRPGGRRRVHRGLRGRRRHRRRAGPHPVRLDAGLPAVPVRRAVLRGRGDVRLLRRRRGGELRPAVRRVRPQGQHPALRVGLPDRGQRAGRAGRVRRRCPDDAALLHRDRQRGEHRVRAGLPGGLRRAADDVRGAGLRRRERAGQGALGVRRRLGPGDHRGARGSRRDRRQPPGPVELHQPDPEQSIYLREVADEGGVLLNTVVEDLGVQPQP